MDDIERIAFFVAHHNNLDKNVVIETLMNQFTDVDDETFCQICKCKMKWKNLLSHTLKKHGSVKINWNKIPIIKAQKDKKKKITKVLGKNEYVHVVQGGSPGLGKKK